MRNLLGLAILVAAMTASVQPTRADLENRVFTSRADRLGMVVPRGWRESEVPSYPGFLLWMMSPNAKMVLTAEPFTREFYCSWPVICRTSREIGTVLGKFACALGQRLTSQHMRVSGVQAGPKENQEAGLPSVWFEYDDGHRFLRQAVALTEDRAISLVLSAPSADARAGNIRAFETALRTLQRLDPAEAPDGEATTAAGNATPAATSSTNPVGPCTQR